MRLTAVSCAVVTAVWQLLIVTRLLDLLSLTKRCEESKSGCDRHQLIAWTVQRHVDFTDCRTSLSHHGRQISESESEAQGTAKGENQQRGSEERATGLSRQGGAEKEVGGRCQTAINLGSLGDSARLSWREDDLQRFDNRGVGTSEMDGHVCNGNR